MLVGKTFWKGLVLPNLLFGVDIIPYRKGDLLKLQSYENKAYRTILGVPRYTAVEFLRGEIGASSALARDAKNKILFLKHALQSENNSMLAEIATNDIQGKVTRWAAVTKKYLRELNLSLEQVQAFHKDAIEKRIYEWDCKQWKEKMNMRSTLKMYSKFKNHPQEVKWFRNGQRYFNMMRARSNTLKLGWREFENDSNKICKICSKGEIETLKHFILECVELQETRNKYILLQLPRIANDDKLMQKILLFEIDNETNFQEMIEIVNLLWQKRNRLIEQLN